MSLVIQISAWDYDNACAAVSKILSYIKIDEKTGKIVGMPKRGEIVDAVWREINMPEGSGAGAGGRSKLERIAI